MTDANLVLGFLNPDAFLGGEMSLDLDASARAIDEHVAAPLGMSTVDAAQAIFRITNGHMADFLRKKTIENGYDPRTFELFAYGGAGPVHATAFARELGVSQVIVPLGNVASVYSALGVLTSDIRYVLERAESATAPFDGPRLGEIFAELAEQARAMLAADGVAEEDVELLHSIDLRYVGQIFDVELPLAQPIADAAAAEAAIDRFDARYDELFGEGAGFREAGVEVLMLRVTGVGRNEPLELGAGPRVDANLDAARKGTRAIAWEGLGRVDTETYDGTRLGAGTTIVGPAVVELPHTSVVLHPGDRAEWSEAGTIEIAVAAATDSAAGRTAAATKGGSQ